MNTINQERESGWERSARWFALLAGGPRSFLRGLSAIVAMLRAA